MITKDQKLFMIISLHYLTSLSVFLFRLIAQQKVKRVQNIKSKVFLHLNCLKMDARFVLPIYRSKANLVPKLYVAFNNSVIFSLLLSEIVFT